MPGRPASKREPGAPAQRGASQAISSETLSTEPMVEIRIAREAAAASR